MSAATCGETVPGYRYAHPGYAFVLDEGV